MSELAGRVYVLLAKVFQRRCARGDAVAFRHVRGGTCEPARGRAGVRPVYAS